MAYVEIRKGEKLITRRLVDEQKARTGLRIRIGSAEGVRVAVGEPGVIGAFDIRVFEGEIPREGPPADTAIPSAPAAEQSGGSLGFSAVGAADGTHLPHKRPEIEGYRVIEPIGQGGMGTVWRAEQLSTRREVALKLMICHSARPHHAQARFEREVELTARLDHPNIARIYDSGLHHGMYYYVMELVDGMPLDRYVASRGLSQNQIVTLMQKVCKAVLYAHLRAVIHRDLKPSNILVSTDGQPHVLDFGLAKALLDEDGAATISVEGQIAGTPAYMSPEQAAGHHDQIDTRTDVFSLGVILYELLTGRPPHDRSGSMMALLHRIAEGQIPRPRALNRSIDSELEAVLLKALARDPDDRYASAGALAKDLASYLNEEPLDAQVPTTLYFLGKKMRKHRKQVVAGAIVLVLLLGTILVAYTQVVAEKAVREAQATELALKTQELTWRELELKALGGDREEARAALGILRDEYISAQDEISNLNSRLGERRPSVALRRLDLAPGPALSRAALVREPSLPGGIESWTLETRGHRGWIARLLYSPDGNYLVSAGYDGTIRLWDSRSAELTRILLDANAPHLDLTWSRDSARLRAGNRANGIPQFEWDIKTGRVDRLGQTSSQRAWHDSSRTSWSAGEGLPGQKVGEIATILDADLPGGWWMSRQPITALALCPEHNALAIGDGDGAIRLLDAESGQLRHARTAAWCGPIRAVCFSPDGKVLATCAGSGTVCLWEAHRWEPLRRFETDSLPDGSSIVSSVAWAPDGAAIARADNGQRVVQILDAQSAELISTLSANVQDIALVSWSPDGTLLAATTKAGPVYVWDVAFDSSEPLAALSSGSSHVNALAWLPDKQRFVTASDDGKVVIWEPRVGARTRSLQNYSGRITCLAFSPEGDILAGGCDDGTVRLWDTTGNWTSKVLRSEPSDGQAKQSGLTAVAWSPDNKQLASTDSGGNIRIWDLDSRRLRRSFRVGYFSASSLAWSPDGRVLLCGGDDGTVRVLDASRDFREHVVLLPLSGSVGPGIAVNVDGDYRGPQGIADHLVYVVRTAGDHVMLSAADFRSQYGWVNEPWQVGTYKPGAEQVERIYVNAISEEPHDGKTWETAFSDLQDALSMAQPGAEVWVAAGIYKPDRETGARTASFRLKNGVRLLGGFAGNETSSYQRDSDSNETILSGDLKGDDGPKFANMDDNSYHVVFALRIDPNSVLDGFTITSGNASGPEEEGHRLGGGMLLMGASPAVTKCVFKRNTAIGYGGAICAGDDSHPGLVKCLVTGNLAGAGGGVAMIPHCSPTFTECRFVGNKAVGKFVAGRHSVENHGGGVYSNHSHPAVTNCVFLNNSAGGGGGMYSCTPLSGTLSGCRFEDNAADEGGGMLIDQANESTLTNCIFIRNTARAGGGGVFTNRHARPVLVNCRFLGNAAETGGGMATGKSSMAVLNNCVFCGNRATHGGAAYSRDRWQHDDPSVSQFDDIRLVNCTLTMNSADGDGGGIWSADESNPKLVNSILWGNLDGGGRDEYAQIFRIRGLHEPEIEYSCIQGWSGSLGGAGNTGRDPQFVDPDGPDGVAGTEDDDLRLAPGSSCIDTGSNAALPADASDLDNDGDIAEPVHFDIEGKPRILNGTVDIGAHESG